MFHSFGNIIINGKKATDFDLYSALLVIEQCGISNVNVPHLLWHGITLDNGHIQRPVTLTPVGERLGVQLSKPV